MGSDFVLHRSCRPKLEVGRGDIHAGTFRLLGMLKARNRARTISAMVKQEGKDPDTATIKVVVLGPNGPEERDVTVASMMAEAAPLEPLGRDCAGCDACVFQASFGCFGYVNYPLTASLERWVVERIQAADTLGGDLLLRAIRDFGYDGSAMADWRRRPELCERSTPLEAIVAKGFLSKKRVSTDQIFQALFRVGNTLDPAHCMGVLMWLGALRVQGSVPGPGTSGNPAALIALTSATTSEQRRAIASLEVGANAVESEIRGFQRLLQGLYMAWVLDLPLLMDA